MPKIGVIGGGMAGAAAARILKSGGANPIVLDKGRDVGGRLATRQSRFGLFDHGAQFVEKGEYSWDLFLDSLGTELVPFCCKFCGMEPIAQSFVPLGSFRNLVAPLLRDIDVRTGVTVRSLARSGTTWTLETVDGQIIPDLAAVLLTPPAPQALALVAAHSDILRAAERVRFEAVWCAMLAFETAVVPWMDCLDARPDIALAVRVNARPGRGDGYDRWVLHATPAWTADNLELEKSVAAAALADRFRGTFGVTAEPVHLAGHRWRYAQVVEPFGQPYLLDAGKALAMAGDWCLGRTARHAYLSGSAAGHAILQLLA